MSASNRAISRLPLSIFTDLVAAPPPPPFVDDANAENSSTTVAAEQPKAPAAAAATNEITIYNSPEEMRRQISKKLRDFHQRQNDKRWIGSKPRVGITTVGQLLGLSPSALLRAVDPLLTDIECRRMVSRICAVCAPQPQSALSLLQSSQQQTQTQTQHQTQQQEPSQSAIPQHPPPFTHITSGMDQLDQCLRGGFRVGTITEIVGRAGVGKSQLVTQLCVMAAKMGRGSVFIDTERKVSLRRMKEMAQERRAAQLGGMGNENMGGSSMSYGGDQFSYHHNNNNEAAHSNQNAIAIGGGGSNSGTTGTSGTQCLLSGGANGSGTYKDAMEVLENVTIHTPGSTKELLDLISTIEEEILIRNEEALSMTSTNASSNDTATATATATAKHPVGLIVLDSIAAPTRRDFGAESAVARVNSIFQIAQTLKRIADQLQVAVVVINQVGNLDEYGQGNAALGVSWHHCVSTRLMLDHEVDPHRMVGGGGGYGYDEAVGHVRIARVVKSNVAPPGKMTFEVNAMGVCALCNRYKIMM